MESNLPLQVTVSKSKTERMGINALFNRPMNTSRFHLSIKTAGVNAENGARP